MQGLYARTAQVFKLNKSSINLLWKDLFSRSINLNSYETFLEEVCLPTLASSQSIKRDSKGRIELVFHVKANQLSSTTPVSTPTSTRETINNTIKKVSVPEFTNKPSNASRIIGSSSAKIDTTPLAPTRQRINLEERARAVQEPIHSTCYCDICL